MSLGLSIDAPAVYHSYCRCFGGEVVFREIEKTTSFYEQEKDKVDGPWRNVSTLKQLILFAPHVSKGLYGVGRSATSSIIAMMIEVVPTLPPAPLYIATVNVTR